MTRVREKMQKFYKPTDNPTLKNFHFQTLIQGDQESFPALCNRVEKEAKHCQFRCDDINCSAEMIAVRDQKVIGTHSKVREAEALKLWWNLATLRRRKMKIESAVKRRGGEGKITGEPLNQLGKFSYSRMKKKEEGERTAKKTINFYNCGNQVTGSIMKHKEIFHARNANCNKCSKIGHFARVCKSLKDIRQVDPDVQEKHEGDVVYNINLFRITALPRSVKPRMASSLSNKNDFGMTVRIPNTHLIRDDLIVAAPTDEDHDRSVELCMQAISKTGLTLNARKCQFG